MTIKRHKLDPFDGVPLLNLHNEKRVKFFLTLDKGDFYPDIAYWRPPRQLQQDTVLLDYDGGDGIFQCAGTCFHHGTT